MVEIGHDRDTGEIYGDITGVKTMYGVVGGVEIEGSRPTDGADHGQAREILREREREIESERES